MILSKSFLTQQKAEKKKYIVKYGTKRKQILYENVELSTRYDSVRFCERHLLLNVANVCLCIFIIQHMESSTFFFYAKSLTCSFIG